MRDYRDTDTIFQDHSTSKESEKILDHPTPSNPESLSNANNVDEFYRTPGINNVGNPNFSLSSFSSYASHDTFGKLSQTILNMLPKSVAEMDESDETRKNTLANLNEVAAGKPDGCKRCEIVIEEIKSRLEEILISMAQGSTSQEQDLTDKLKKLILYILSKTFPETELTMAKALAKQVSKIVSDRSDQVSSSSDVAKQAVVDVFSKIVSNERSESSSLIIPSRKNKNLTQEELDEVPCKLSKDVITK